MFLLCCPFLGFFFLGPIFALRKDFFYCLRFFGVFSSPWGVFLLWVPFLGLFWGPGLSSKKGFLLFFFWAFFLWGACSCFGSFVWACSGAPGGALSKDFFSFFFFCFFFWGGVVLVVGPFFGLVLGPGGGL